MKCFSWKYSSATVTYTCLAFQSVSFFGNNNR